MQGLVELSSVLNINPTLLVIVLIWSLIWKGLALWKSASKKSVVWFIILLIVNTLGILEILYIFIFSKMSFAPEKVKTNSKTKTTSRKKKTKKK